MEIDDLVPDKRRILARHEFFHDMPGPVIERLASHSRLTAYPAGRRLFQKGDEGAGLLAVVTGLVKISVPLDDGREAVLNHVTAGEIFGEIALLDGEPRTADATAVAKSQILSLDRRDFLGIVAEEPEIAIRLLAVVSRRLRQTSRQVEDLTFADVPTRLAKALLRMADLQDPKGLTGRITITQRELGQTVGLSRESTNKCLRRWQRAGYVLLEKGSCSLKDRAALNLLANAQAHGP
jgi:CRP-like cAMP-binding protein